MVDLNLELKFFILGVVFLVLLVALLDLIELLEDLLDLVEGAIVSVIVMLLCWLFMGQVEIQLILFLGLLIALLGIWVALRLLRLIFQGLLKAEQSKKDRRSAYYRVGNRK